MPAIEKEYGFGQLEIAEQPKKSKKKKEEPVQEEIQNKERVTLTDAAIMDIINNYCGHEAGVRNLKKAIDRIFRKIVAKLESPHAAASPDEQNDILY